MKRTLILLVLLSTAACELTSGEHELLDCMSEEEFADSELEVVPGTEQFADDTVDLSLLEVAGTCASSELNANGNPNPRVRCSNLGLQYCNGDYPVWLYRCCGNNGSQGGCWYVSQQSSYTWWYCKL